MFCLVLGRPERSRMVSRQVLTGRRLSYLLFFLFLGTGRSAQASRGHGNNIEQPHCWKPHKATWLNLDDFYIVINVVIVKVTLSYSKPLYQICIKSKQFVLLASVDTAGWPNVKPNRLTFGLYMIWWYHDKNKHRQHS